MILIILKLLKKTSIIKNLWYTEYKSWNKWIYNDAILDNYFTDNLFKATEKENGKYLLNLWSSMDVFDRTISYDILSPINLLITDQQWRRIWIDPESWIIINEIPWAWTSWNTEGSWESEFFVIPVSWTWSIIHEIQTFWTGDWKYDIVVREYLWDKQKAKSLVITWNAKYDYWEKYRLKISELSEKSFEQISKSTKLNISRKNSRWWTNNSIDYKSNFLIFPEKDIIFEEVLLNNFDYNFNFYNNMKNYFNSKLWFALHHSFSARLSYDNQVVKVLLYNGKTNSFSRQKDFSYKKQLENNLELKENSLYFIIKDLDKSYYFSKQDLLLKKIKNAKKEFILHYDHYKRLKYVSLWEKKIFEFFYDKNTWLLSIIKDHHGNIIELIYEKIDDFYLLSKLNGKPYNFKDVVKLDIFKITFDKNIQYQEKLESIREKVLNLKVKDYRKKILASKIKNIKFDFLKRIKSDYNKNKLNYFIDNIIYFLNS